MDLVAEEKRGVGVVGFLGQKSRVTTPSLGAARKKRNTCFTALHKTVLKHFEAGQIVSLEVDKSLVWKLMLQTRHTR